MPQPCRAHRRPPPRRAMPRPPWSPSDWHPAGSRPRSPPAQAMRGGPHGRAVPRPDSHTLPRSQSGAPRRTDVRCPIESRPPSGVCGRSGRQYARQQASAGGSSGVVRGARKLLAPVAIGNLGRRGSGSCGAGSQARRGQSGAGELHPVARRQCHAVRLDEPRLREQLDEHEPRYESTHVRPYGDTTGYVRAHLGQFGQAREELEPEPVEQHQPGRNRDDLEEDDEEEEHPDAHLRVEQQIRTHDPGNRPRRAHRRHWRRRIEGDVRGRRDQAADEVEREEAPRPHRVLNVVAEHPEEERVANDVHPAAVQEHGGQRREDVDWQIVHDACHPGAYGHSEPKRSLVRQFARYHAEIADARGKYHRRKSCLFHEQPDGPGYGQDGVGHPRRPERRQFVAERDHVRLLAGWRSSVRDGDSCDPVFLFDLSSVCHNGALHRHQDCEKVLPVVSPQRAGSLFKHPASGSDASARLATSHFTRKLWLRKSLALTWARRTPWLLSWRAVTLLSFRMPKGAASPRPSSGSRRTANGSWARSQSARRSPIRKTRSSPSSASWGARCRKSPKRSNASHTRSRPARTIWRWWRFRANATRRRKFPP